MVSTHLKHIILVKLDHLPRDWGEHKKYLKPPPRHRLHLSGQHPFLFDPSLNQSQWQLNHGSCRLLVWSHEKPRYPLGKAFPLQKLQHPYAPKFDPPGFSKGSFAGFQGGGYNQQKYIDWYIWKSICTTRQYTDRPLWVFDGMMTCYLMLMGKMSPITWYSKLAKKTHCYYFITISAALACPSNTGWWMLISLTNTDDFTALELGEASS